VSSKHSAESITSIEAYVDTNGQFNSILAVLLIGQFALAWLTLLCGYWLKQVRFVLVK